MKSRGEPGFFVGVMWVGICRDVLPCVSTGIGQRWSEGVETPRWGVSNRWGVPLVGGM